MKKFLINIVIVMIIGITTFSCNKEKTNVQNLETGDNTIAALSGETLAVNRAETITEQTGLAQRYNIFQHSPEQNQGECFLRIWGWSRDGKVALSVDNSSPARGGFTIDYYIIDIITDEISFHLSADSFDYEDIYNFDIYNNDLNNVNLLYNTTINEITTANNKNGIIEAQTDFLSFPITKNNFQYTCFADEQNTDENGMVKINFNIIVSRDGSKKTIGTNSGYGPGLSLNICGYLLSPYENRILVVYATTKHFSGDVFVDYFFNGCHLDIGF